MGKYLNRNELYVLYKDGTDKTISNVLSFTFNIVNHYYVIFYIENDDEKKIKIKDDEIKYFNLD